MTSTNPNERSTQSAPSPQVSAGSSRSAGSADVATASSSGTGSAASPGGTPSVRTSLAARFAAARGGADTPGGAETVATGHVGSPDSDPATAPRSTASANSAPTAARGAAQHGPEEQTRAFQPAASPYRPAAQPAPQTAPAATSARAANAGPRRVRLALARMDPWSVMKLSFLLSIAVGIGIVVATAAMWYVLDSMHVFADIQDLLDSIGSESFIDLMEYLAFDRVISLAAVIAVIDVFLLTALCTLGAFLYNIVAALVGGIHLTLTDD